MTYRIGIDAGSKTIKVVVIDQEGGIVRQIYRRHRSNIIQTLKEVLHDVEWTLGSIDGSVVFTGSAGIGIAEEIGAPFVQEVIATTTAVQKFYPQADAIIELGGEDAKIIYLTGGIEQRMNASCAGGTGGFIDTIAFMLGTRSCDMGHLAYGCRHVYPIASRCAVFAQTDIRPLINAGVPKADLAGSVFQAIVRQTLGGLACGRPLRGNIVFLGGPLEYNDSLVTMFRKELNLNKNTGIKPKDAHLFTAYGAAQHANDETEDNLSFLELISRLNTIDTLKDDLERLAPLFANEEELRTFKERHASCAYPLGKLFFARGPLYLGIDAGSTTVKIAVLDQEGTLVYQQYAQTEGDTAHTLRLMLLDLYQEMPQPYVKGGEAVAWIARSMVTGYGEDMIKALFGVDEGLVETAAHLRAARQLCPDVTFVLDIGGQDMKALWVKDGVITDAVLNEACSSGCGSFVEGTAYSLKSTPYKFVEMALTAQNPVDLGTRCTVFMTSRVRHAQKIGAGIDDIAAGIAYSVVQNALYRIIGAQRVASMGDHIVVQGGTFKSDAVLRAFELISGREVIRYDQAHLMGAIGAALTARDAVIQSGKNFEEARSNLVSREAMKAMRFQRRSLTCSGCANACPLSMISASDTQVYISGNRCSHGLQEFARRRAALVSSVQGQETSDAFLGKEVSRVVSDGQVDLGFKAKILDPPSVFMTEQELLGTYNGTQIGSTRASVNIGLMNAMELYGTVPFWHGVLSALGFTVTVDSPSASDTGKSAAWETIPSESVCYPAKLAHLRYFNLMQQGVDAVFMPTFERHSHCIVSSSYALALADNLPSSSVPLLTPHLTSYKPASIISDEQNCQKIEQTLREWAKVAGVELSPEEVHDALQVGFAEQQAYDEQIKRATEEVLAWVEADPTRHAVVLAGRSYHGDQAISKSIDVELQKLSVAVLSMRGLNQVLREQKLSGQSEQSKQPIQLEESPSWKPAKRLRSVAKYVATHPCVDLVCLQSFGCGYDAVSFEDVSGILETAHKPFTVLKIDDITDLAHIRIRLRTLVDAIKKRSIEKRLPGSVEPLCLDAKTKDVVRVCEPELPDESDTVSFGTNSNSEAASSGLTKSFVNTIIAPDLEVLRQDTIKDVCFTAQTMAAQVIGQVKADPSLQTIELPIVCKNCLFDAVPLMVERATGRKITTKWVDVADLRMPTQQDAAAGKGGRTPESITVDESIESSSVSSLSSRPRIGIVGNALMCYRPALNDNLVGLLDSLGVEAILPDPELVQVEDVRYIDQLTQYEQAGITEVIYVQSFGCLKGHVQSRGALHQLKKRFPGLNITVIDYDPEASALNRENRIRLVVETLKKEAQWE